MFTFIKNYFKKTLGYETIVPVFRSELSGFPKVKVKYGRSHEEILWILSQHLDFLSGHDFTRSYPDVYSATQRLSELYKLELINRIRIPNTKGVKYAYKINDNGLIKIGLKQKIQNED